MPFDIVLIMRGPVKSEEELAEAVRGAKQAIEDTAADEPKLVAIIRCDTGEKVFDINK